MRLHLPQGCVALAQQVVGEQLRQGLGDGGDVLHVMVQRHAADGLKGVAQEVGIHLVAVGEQLGLLLLVLGLQDALLGPDVLGGQLVNVVQHLVEVAGQLAHLVAGGDLHAAGAVAGVVGHEENLGVDGPQHSGVDRHEQQKQQDADDQVGDEVVLLQQVDGSVQLLLRDAEVNGPGRAVQPGLIEHLALGLGGEILHGQQLLKDVRRNLALLQQRLPLPVGEQAEIILVGQDGLQAPAQEIHADQHLAEADLLGTAGGVQAVHGQMDAEKIPVVHGCAAGEGDAVRHDQGGGG